MPMEGRLPEKLAAARLLACALRPYFSQALFALYPIECEAVGTMAVDEWWRLYWAPKFVNAHSTEELATVLIHEVEHLLRQHCDRRETREALAWNVAGDLEINDGLAEQRLPLPWGALLPTTFGLPDGRLAEEYFDSVEKRIIRIGVSLKGKPSPGGGTSGSCADGIKRPWERGEPAGDDDHTARGKADGDSIRRSVAEAVNKEPGSVPGNLRRWAERVLKPQVNWRAELRAQVRAAVGKVQGMSDYSYARPSRRQHIYGKVIRPSQRDPVPKVALVIDTSGSMSDEQLAQGLAEVKGVLAAVGNTESIRVLSCDAAVHTCKEVFNERQVELTGGGGTEMGAGIEAASKLEPKPDIIIVFTDGYTGWPSEAPQGVKVVVCVCTEDGTSPSWARTVRVPVERQAA